MNKNEIDFEDEFNYFNNFEHWTSKQVTVVDEKEIRVTSTGHDWDALAVVENKTDEKIYIDFFDYEGTLIIEPHSYCLLLNDANGRAMLGQFHTANWQITDTEVE